MKNNMFLFECKVYYLLQITIIISVLFTNYDNVKLGYECQLNLIPVNIVNLTGSFIIPLMSQQSYPLGEKENRVI